MQRHRAARRALLCALALGCAAPAVAVPPLPVLDGGRTTRVSIRGDGSQASHPDPRPIVDELSISADGHYVAFYTNADVGAPRCRAGTYLRDLKRDRLEMVSVPARGCGDRGTGGGSNASYTSISPDGRYVAFASYATNLLPGRTLPEYSPTRSMTLQVFLRDRVRKRTVLVSEGLDGRPANGSAGRPTVSDDGRFVAFESPATNLVRGDKGDPDDMLRTEIFVRDLKRGVTVRVGPEIRSKGRGFKIYPSMSGNGRYVAFEALDGYLAPHKGDGQLIRTTVWSQAYVWDRVTGVTELVSRNDAGYAAAGMARYDGFVGSKISRDGRWITYVSDALNLTGVNGAPLYDAWQVYLYDRVAKRTTRVTNGLAGEAGNAESKNPCLSADGRYVAFSSAASNLGDADLTPGYFDGYPDVGTDVYRYDRVTKTTRLVSRSSDGVQGDRTSYLGCPSNDGTVVFASIATNLVPGDTNGIADVFVRRYPSAP